TLRRGIRIAVRQLRQRAGDAFLVELAYLPCHRGVASAEALGERSQCITEAGAAFVQNERRAQARDLRDRIAERFRFCREETEKKEAVGRQSGKRERGNCCRWSWNCVHRMSSRPGSADKLIAGVRDQGRSRVAD